MIFLAFIPLLFLPSNAGFINSVRVHNSDLARLKCEELPYRTAHIGARCYFAVTKKVNYSEASAECATSFPGAQLASNVPYAVFSTMMLEKSKFHVAKDSSDSTSGAKPCICAYDSGYKCDAGEQSRIIPGKCVTSTNAPHLFEEAENYCSKLGMEVPIIDNELDNRMIRDAIKNFAWIRNVYDGKSTRKWERKNSFSKHKTCPRGNSNAPAALLSGSEMALGCGQKMSSAIEANGYWGISISTHPGGMGAVCSKNAENDFTRKERKPCVKHHEWDEDTGLCEWTGPKDACLQTIDYRGRTWWATLPNFPRETAKEFNFGDERNDAITKIIVRRGCMYSGWDGDVKFPKNVMGDDLGYGEYNIPCYYTGTLRDPGEGLTRLQCFCDPTVATLNDHVPAPPPKKKCIEHHVFNETTQSCEWIHEPKFCGELITYDGRRQKVEIPSGNRLYNVDHWNWNNGAKRGENFHVQITQVIVRQHCWFTMYHWDRYTSHPTLEMSGYGRHEVLSYYNSKYGTEHDGTHRVICDCYQ